MAARGLAAVLTLTASGLAAGAVAQAQDDAESIMRAYVHQGSARDESVEIRMLLVGPDGQERHRTAILYTKKRGPEEDMRLVRFESPPDLEKSGVLVIEQADRDADQWLYMPAYHTSRRIASVSRGDTWMGTDFTYEDMVDPKPSQYAYRVVREEALDGVACTVIEAIPRDPRLAKESAYSKTVYWIDRDRSVAPRIEYYDRGGILIKTLVNSNPGRAGGYWRWQRSEMRSLKREHRTVLEMSNRKLDQGLGDSYFTVRYLERGR